MAEPRVVTFTTDFGLNDPFVGIMHGVVLSIHPETRMVDICHAIPSFNVPDAAWTIAQAYRFFPPRSVHVIVVDPGVGSARRPILAETEDYIFVAPDNGVLSLIEMREPKFTVRHITAERYFLQPVSQTFHGRDIFAPVAAWLSKGVEPAEFGPEVSDHVRLPLPGVERIGENSLRGAVLKVENSATSSPTSANKRCQRCLRRYRRHLSCWLRARPLHGFTALTRTGAMTSFSRSLEVRGTWKLPPARPQRRRNCQPEWARRWA